MPRRAKSIAKKSATISFAPENSATAVEEKPLAFSVDSVSENTQESPQNSPPENFPKPFKDRLSWPISESGKFDVEGFRKETAEQAREIARASFLDPEFRKWAGIEQETGQIAEAVFPKSIAGQALDLIASVETLAMAKKTGLTYEECHKFMAWNQREHEVLDEQGARLARKYVPAKWLENMDLYIFITSIAGLAAGKMRMTSEYAAKRVEQIGNAPDSAAGKKIDPPKVGENGIGSPKIPVIPSDNVNQVRPPEQEGKSLE